MSIEVIADSTHGAIDWIHQGETLLFVFGHGMRFNERMPRLLMKSLDPDTIYGVEAHGALPASNKAPKSYKPPTYRAVSGRALMESGVLVGLAGDYDSRILHFKARGEN